MGSPLPPRPVLPILGVLGPASLPPEFADLCAGLFGPPLLASEAWDFRATRYYEDEMGTALRRRFLSFAPAGPEALADWKMATNAWERNWTGPSGRRWNLDPGYLSLTALYLASTKPGTHRVYLRDGIYAEITLLRRHRAWEPLPWTFPEFRAPTYHGYFTACREMLRKRLAARGAPLPDAGSPSPPC